MGFRDRRTEVASDTSNGGKRATSDFEGAGNEDVRIQRGAERHDRSHRRPGGRVFFAIDTARASIAVHLNGEIVTARNITNEFELTRRRDGYFSPPDLLCPLGTFIPNLILFDARLDLCQLITAMRLNRLFVATENPEKSFSRIS